MLLRFIRLSTRGGGGLSLRLHIASLLCLVNIVSRIFCKNIALFEIVVLEVGSDDDRLRSWCFVFFRISPSTWYVVIYFWVYQGKLENY